MAKITKANTFIFSVLTVLIVIGIIISGLRRINTDVVILKDDQVILELNPLKNKEIIVNDNQIVKITVDGIVSYNLQGKELWADTLNLENIVVKQQEPYFAVASREARELTIFSDKGKQGYITTNNPIIYHSINEQGDVAIIEKVNDEGYRVSAYDVRGNFVKGRMSYSSSGSIPIAAQIDPNSSILLMSYINILESNVTSAISALPLAEDEINAKDALIYGIEETNNMVFEIQFISDNIWVAVGDEYFTFYTIGGELVKRVEGIRPTYIPYITSNPKFGKYFPVVGSDNVLGTTAYINEVLYMFNLEGEIEIEIPLDENTTYFYADQKGVVLGQGRKYIGYNKMGNQYMEYRATQDVKKVIPVNNHAIAVTKDSVILLK